jgi:hypothetical protein
MTKSLTHSFSSIKMFEQCPFRYYHQRIAKTVVDRGGEASQHGERIHKYIEDRLKGTLSVERAAEIAKLEPIISSIEMLANGGTLEVEQQLTLNKELKPTTWFAPDAWMRSILDVCVRCGDKTVVLDWKGLALDTPIPTPGGWTTMGDIKVGDMVFDAHGEQCSVVGKSKVKNVRCFEVTFSDTTKVVCDEEHLWKLHDGSVVGVQDLMGIHGKTQRVHTPRISVAQPLALPDTELPIDPYVLGLWIADGKHTSSEISKPDTFIWEEIQRRGYAVDMETGGNRACPTRTVKGIRGVLKSLGLLGNKHIPAQYLRAGYQQRLDLLRGLMDGDGNANPTRKQAVFTTTDSTLSDAVCELLCSLGQRPLKSVVTAKGFGKVITAYPVSFRPLGVNPFLLPRKASRIGSWSDRAVHNTRFVVSVQEVSSVPTQCIAVDSTDHTFLCTERMIPTHNTGKRRPDFTQLELFALQVFAHHPDTKRVDVGFIWTQDLALDKESYRRDDAPAMWERLLTRVQRIEDAAKHDVWPAKPSGLCRYCPCNTFCESAA